MNRNTLRRLASALTLVVGLLTSCVVSGNSAVAPAEPPAPVTALEVDRYLGTWYQLAAIPQYFDLVCARDTRAEYTLDARGDVAVHNSCTTWSGGPNDIRGTATVTDPSTRAQLHVSFPGVPTQDARYGPANYVVTALGADYSWALVTDPHRSSGFVLSRTPALEPAEWLRIRAAIAAAGEDACWYLTSPTSGGIEAISPLCVA
ncbi:lipocalin [Nocardia sp. ET3-3]|uniref:Lipocalin n=1 Tax=Nocardia terrae TaxID=2675851 RepID=A0A7K1UT93_9NOCA|nr:lipocalin family protein [Nocardia terrae]MVU77582.1 lipocalin [Nocardia terrae]